MTIADNNSDNVVCNSNNDNGNVNDIWNKSYMNCGDNDNDSGGINTGEMLNWLYNYKRLQIGKLQDERCNYLTKFFYFGKVVTLITECAWRPSFGRCHSPGNRLVSHVNNKQPKLKTR